MCIWSLEGKLASIHSIEEQVMITFVFLSSSFKFVCWKKHIVAFDQYSSNSSPRSTNCNESMSPSIFYLVFLQADLKIWNMKYDCCKDFIMGLIQDSGVLGHPTWTGGVLVSFTFTFFLGHSSVLIMINFSFKNDQLQQRLKIIVKIGSDIFCNRIITIHITSIKTVRNARRS